MPVSEPVVMPVSEPVVMPVSEPVVMPVENVAPTSIGWSAILVETQVEGSQGTPRHVCYVYMRQAQTVMNSSELNGKRVLVSAGGRFEPQDDATDLPKRFNAFIEGGV
eukprot:5375684-Pyramimonas_sp.AAC.1